VAEEVGGELTYQQVTLIKLQVVVEALEDWFILPANL
jgi:hypothetical protein